MDKQSFVDQMKRSIEALQNVVNTYEAYIPEAAGTVNAADEEARLFALFEAYLTADKALKDTQAEFQRITGDSETRSYEDRRMYRAHGVKAAVDKTAALSLSEIRQAEADAEAEWERGHVAALVVKAARETLSIAKQQIHDTMPHHAWIKYPARNLAFGIDTGTWGGYCWHLHVLAADGKLHQLIHQTYYA